MCVCILFHCTSSLGRLTKSIVCRAVVIFQCQIQFSCHAVRMTDRCRGLMLCWGCDFMRAMRTHTIYWQITQGHNNTIAIGI